MSRHFLITALRNIQKHKASTLLNIVGLAIGMAACILILMWARYEIEWDQFHENVDDIYLVATLHDHGSDISYGWGAPPAVAPALADEYPEVVAAARSTSSYGYTIQYGDVIIDQHRGSRFVDPEYLTMFSFEFVSGDPETALDDVHSVVLTEKVAQQLFGDEDPLGKTVTVEYDYAFRVTGVVREIPINSTLRFESLASIEFIRELSDRPDYIDTWYNCSFNHFVRMRPGTDVNAFNEKIAERIRESRPNSNITPFVYPFKNLNLYSVDGNGGFVETVILISLIAFLVLLIACINFMNMATAQAANRAREVGVRKVVGALRRELIRQFYFESMLQAVLATVLALVLVEQLLPMFRGLTTYPLFVDYTGDPVFWGCVLAITAVTGLISGSYPALVLSAFQPASVLKGSLAAGVRGAWFRRGLVIVQFTVTTVLVICTYIVYQQFQHMQNKSVGYDRQNLVRLKMDGALQPRYETLKIKLLEHTDILEVTKATHSLSGVYWNGVGWNWENKESDVNPMVTYMGVGDNWLETFGTEMTDGQFYSVGTEFNEREVLINESLAKMMGDESPVGKWIANTDDDEPESYIVRGVVKDFHFKPVYRPVEPIMIFHNADYSLWSAFIRVSGENVPETLAQRRVRGHVPVRPFPRRDPARFRHPRRLDFLPGIVRSGILHDGAALQGNRYSKSDGCVRIRNRHAVDQGIHPLGDDRQRHCVAGCVHFDAPVARTVHLPCGHRFRPVSRCNRCSADDRGHRGEFPRHTGGSDQSGGRHTVRVRRR
jgi:hypothetical protein